jgi:hypothetical protein
MPSPRVSARLVRDQWDAWMCRGAAPTAHVRATKLARYAAAALRTTVFFCTSYRIDTCVRVSV